MLKIITLLLMSCVPLFAWSTEITGKPLDLTQHWMGYTAIGIFAFAYVFVMMEEFIHLRKSKPVILAAGLIWIGIAIVYGEQATLVEQAFRHNLLEYAELFLFLMVAMTYINAMEERQVFDALRSWMINRGFSYQQLFWITGCLAFLLSPVADNLTTALVMCAVVMAVGSEKPKFVLLSCISIVVAANAGGAFSPFGDITTLMVWQKGMVKFQEFFALFLPSVANYLIPAIIMSFAIPKETPTASGKMVGMKVGAKRIIVLFLFTIVTAVSVHNFWHLPPVLGMMTGLAYLQFFGFYLKMRYKNQKRNDDNSNPLTFKRDVEDATPFDIFDKVARSEWDTLLFFYGVVMSVGGLGFIGYLELSSTLMYQQLGATYANVLVGLLSAIVDNIPVMFAVLSMQPDMSHGQWLLVTLTAGVGGSLLSIGSAAGVALMGQARGMYTFFGHLKWTPVIALGYATSIGLHFLINSRYFH